MDKFLELLRESVIVQALLTLLIWSTISYMYIKGMDVPEGLLAGGGAILGYYFGTKTQLAVNKIAKVHTIVEE